MKLSLLLALASLNAFAMMGDSPRIRLNTVGYTPVGEKKASIIVPCTNFCVVRVSDGVSVLSGTATGPVLNPDTGEQVYTADFSALHETGQYRLVVENAGDSAPFGVGRDIFQEPYYTAMRGFYLWRCGMAVKGTYSGQTFAHEACHTNDGWLDFVQAGHTRKSGARGWHDAGDYNKYVVNAGVTVGVLFRAWEDFGPQIRKIRLDLPESGGKLPDFLAEIKWELDWLLTMQAQDGSVYHKLSTTRFGGFIPPDQETAERYFTPWGTEATADFVGIMAQSARIYRPYDKSFAKACLRAAERGNEFLKSHPGYHKADQAGFSTGAYEVNQPDHRLDGMPNNRVWAEAELWETTGKREVLKALEDRVRACGARVGTDFDWDEVKELGLITYALSRRSGRDEALLNLARSNLFKAADSIVETRNHHGYGRPLGTTYFWGCNGAVARQAVLLVAAERVCQQAGTERIAGNSHHTCAEYRETCLAALNYLFGRNCFGRSFVTGIGFEPPLHPHDRRSVDGRNPWPGYLVGGAHPKASDWQDAQADFRVNEIAINWNAALVYALAAGME
jgi:endoglucanase